MILSIKASDLANTQVFIDKELHDSLIENIFFSVNTIYRQKTTDFEQGFICAETIAYSDYEKLGGEQGAKDNGKMRLEGKEYTVHDGDVVHFRFNV